MQVQTMTSNSGSHWARWEPHIHAPGTILNDQFKGPDCWDRYLDAIEKVTPPIRALGVTDYYSTETYQRVIEAKRAGRLAGCDLIFPNIEMRLALGTVKGKWVNVHLLVSPDDANHLDETVRFLRRLTFRAYDDTYSCSKDDLIRLGQRVDPKLKDPAAAFPRGCEQFKVTFDDLRTEYQESAWAKENILIAVAGSETDGTSGMRDGADATLRQEVEKFAHIILASSVAQREFWLGIRGLSPDQIRARYGNLKPCIHGSDAHALSSIDAPDGNRYTWIKGVPAFDTLRQACIDPAGRAYVGEQAPLRATPSQVVAAVEIKNAPWARTPSLELNPGLIAIIGARGSGKTALADTIAHGCSATSDRLSDSSFLRRAQELLGGASVTLKWQEGDDASRPLDGSDDWFAEEYPRARYLSQKFVEELCSANGMTDELLHEIERVIFEAHPMADRDGEVDFEGLRDSRTMRFQDAREREENALASISERIGVEGEKRKQVGPLMKQVDEKRKLIQGYTKDRSKLVSKGSEERVKGLAELSEAADKVRGYLRTFVAREQTLLAMQDEVRNVRGYGAPEALRKMSERHKSSALKPGEWQEFLLKYTGDVDGVIATHLGAARKGTKDWKGAAQPPAADPAIALIAAGAELERQPLALLEAEISRLEKLIGEDKDAARKFSAISKRITEETAALQRLQERLADCEGAKDRAAALVVERETAYQRVFDAIVAEENVLRELYSPLMARLGAAGGSLKKLSFSVNRIADVGKWAAAGEELLDLRQKGSFKGRGTLRQLADASLKQAWETGDAKAVTDAMAKFRSDNQEALLDQAPVPKSQEADYREWSKRFAKWLYGTDHISIQYSIDYDGVDIRKLSPGSRGIVLLLLYLALDEADDRPLIIDQPEENLDPKSIFDELVGLFIEAKSKRQVIIITHNANLVVNTDADQVLVAQAGPHVPGQLPPISYVSGGLESGQIRQAVCDILEGGERAFQERARRLRVSLDR
jgi:AAA domain, putative AbiEii toxin, Type IV TA system